MKVSKKAYYGLRAVISLAKTGHPTSVHDLAQTEHIPEDFLEKILQKLRHAGIVKSTKGADGGYALARSAQKISAWDVLGVLDGPIQTFTPPVIKKVLPASNAGHVAPAGWPCPPPSHCQTNEVWRKLEQEIEGTLSKITLEKLIRNNAKAQISNIKSNPESK